MDGRMFRLRLEQWAKDFNGDMDAIARQVSQRIALNVVQDTPVDTGFLRGSWQPSLNEVGMASGALDPGGAKAIAQIGAVVAGMKAGQIFYMTNNASYAPFVEFGTSKMAGRFFVTDNMKKAGTVVSQVVKELKK